MSDTTQDKAPAPNYVVTFRRPDGTGGTCEAPTLREVTELVAPWFKIVDDDLEIHNLTTAMTLFLRKRGRA